MSRLIIAALMGLLCLPAFADSNGTTPLIIWRNGATRTLDVEVTKSSNISSPDVALDWVPINGDNNSWDYLDIGGVLTLSPPTPPNPRPIPSISGFKAAVLSDSTIPSNEKLELMKYMSVVNDYMTNPAGVQAAWGLIVATDTVISSGTFTEVEADATANNIALIAP